MKINHEHGCKCVICLGRMTRREFRSQKLQSIRKYGWYALFAADPQIATGFNYHTHGFNKTLGHFDLQIVLPLDPVKCHGIAKTIYGQIKGGKVFRDGDETTIPHQDGSEFPVRFVRVRERDRSVLRVILPNSDGDLEPKQAAEGDDPEYALQWIVGAV